jgi:hypothetical protein
MKKLTSRGPRARNVIRVLVAGSLLASVIACTPASETGERTDGRALPPSTITCTATHVANRAPPRTYPRHDERGTDVLERAAFRIDEPVLAPKGRHERAADSECAAGHGLDDAGEPDRAEPAPHGSHTAACLRDFVKHGCSVICMQ